MAERLRLHAFEPASRANGPGLRAVLWTRGCSLACPGCFNPETHAFSGGELVDVDELAERVAGLEGIEGVTVSGGEPLQQRPALLAFLRWLRQRTRLSVLVFTGFTWEEVRRFPEAEALLGRIDVLLAGRYDVAQHLGRGLLGSANKTAHYLSGRYGPADLAAVPPAEVVITAEGEVVASGIDPLRW